MSTLYSQNGMITTPHEYSTVRLGVESGSSYRSIEAPTIRDHPYCMLIFLSTWNRMLYATVSHDIAMLQASGLINTFNKPLSKKISKSGQCIQKMLPILHGRSRFKVSLFCHIINYTGYNQKWNVNQIRSAQWSSWEDCIVWYQAKVNMFILKSVILSLKTNHP